MKGLTAEVPCKDGEQCEYKAKGCLFSHKRKETTTAAATVSDTGVLSVLRNCHGMKRLALASCQSIGACALWMCGDAIAASDSSSAAVSMQVVTWLSLLCYLMASLRSHHQNVLKRRKPPTTATVVRGRPS